MTQQLELDLSPPSPQLKQLWTPDDIFKALNGDIVQLFKEDGRLERKPATIHARELSDYLCMWANTQPYGGVSRAVWCKICNGNDANVPCAYTTERPAGCLRLKRLGLPHDLSESDVLALFSMPDDDDTCHQQGS